MISILRNNLKLSQMRPNDPYVLYNLSCSYSLLKDINQAFDALEKAFVCGYRDFQHAEDDADLQNLRDDLRFESFWSGMKSNYGCDESQDI